jgi:hypothetical protein
MLKYDEQIEAWYRRKTKEDNRKFVRYLVIICTVAIVICIIAHFTFLR